jgi:hypothetical protein
MPTDRRPPTSARHAFALAFDLAVRRDALQSLWVPLLLHAPWLVLQAIVPAPDEPGGFSARNLMLSSVILVGDFAVSLLVAAMLRFRALSVYTGTSDGRPAAALACYARGARKLPWLFVTELLRNVAILGAGVFLLLPGIWVGFRFSLATEAVVLRDTGVLGAFGRSYRLTEARVPLDVVVDVGDRGVVPARAGHVRDPVRVDVLLPPARGHGRLGRRAARGRPRRPRRLGPAPGRAAAAAGGGGWQEGEPARLTSDRGARLRPLRHRAILKR